MPYDPNVAKQQADLNAANQGKAGYVPLKVDGLLGPLTQGAIQKYGFNTQTGQPNTPGLPPLKTEEDIRVEPTSSLGNFRTALRAAAEEAGKNRSANLLGQFSAAGLGGGKPGSLGNIAATIRGSVKPSVESVFSDVMTGYTEEQKLKQERKTSALNMMNTVIDNGVFADTPAGTLLAWEKEAGLPEGTALAWQARLKIEQDKSEELGELQLRKLRQDVNDADTPDEPTNATDIMQTYVDAGATPEEAARKATAAMEALGVPVDQKTLGKLTVQARKLKKTTASTIEAPLVTPITAKGAGQAVRGGVKPLYDAFKPENLGSGIKDIGSGVGSFFSGLFGG